MAFSVFVIPALTTASSWSWSARCECARRWAAGTALSKRSVRSWTWKRGPRADLLAAVPNL